MRTRSPHALAGLLCLVVLAAACKDDPSGGGGTETEGNTDDSSSSTTVEPTTSTTGSDSGVDSSSSGGDPGAPPPTPTLMSPTDEAIDVVVDGAEICWNLVEDPDGDPVRYRVFVDGIELTAGRLGPEGYDGPCLPLTLNFEQTYAWQVSAFNPDFPESESEPSEMWSFTTATDGITHTVFEEDFEDVDGWQVEGDASNGQWVCGEPNGTLHFDQIAQPDRCFGGQHCCYTGENLDGIVDEADVAGGSTMLTSPEFDLTGAVTATVQLARFFYKSGEELDTVLRVELLTPDDAEADGYRHHVLEELGSAPTATASNIWLPREYAACGVPMVEGSRLRIIATDLGEGITEGALDSVAVIAHGSDAICNFGSAGSKCDPEMGAMACPDELLCCEQGAVNAGVFRCADPVAGIDYTSPPANPDDPGNGEIGCDGPDIFVDTDELAPEIDTLNVQPDSCSLFEGCVGGTGVRTLLRFDTFTPNVGSRDMAMGVPSNHPDLFHFSECHEHYHFDNYAAYELRDDVGVVATGHKQAFCLIDLYGFAWGGNGQFDCGNQGISRGFADVYGKGLDCQWIDVTDVPPGDYTLRISLNTPPVDVGVPVLNERNYENNVADIEVTIP